MVMIYSLCYNTQASESNKNTQFSYTKAYEFDTKGENSRIIFLT